MHPSYDLRTSDYDIALLELVEPVTYDDKLKPVCLDIDGNFGEYQFIHVLTRSGIFWPPLVSCACTASLLRVAPPGGGATLRPGVQETRPPRALFDRTT